MPLYKIRNVLQARGVKAFWKLEAGLTRGPAPEQDQAQDQQSQERIRRLQQELHTARQEINDKNQRLKKLKTQQQGQKAQQNQQARKHQRAQNNAEQSQQIQIDPAEFGATLPIPPNDVGTIVQARDGASYLKTGHKLKSMLLHYTGVTQKSNILDIGAGPGRVARHFVDFIEPPGRYVGMDIEKPNMDWCEENIAAANPAFNFFHQDVYNGLYNPRGKSKASEYRFPFKDGSFDMVFLTSIFTHLVPEDAQNYLSEISRLLKPDGVCFCTWFLLGHDLNVKYMGPHSKETRVGYGFRYILEMLEESGLTLVEDPVLGLWHGREDAEQDRNPVGNQDLLLLRPVQNEAGSLTSRYSAPTLPEDQSSNLEEANGTVKLFDPVSSSLTIQNKEEEKTFGVPAEAELRINGQSTDSALLRQGQEAHVQFVRDQQTGVLLAQAVHVTDKPRKLDEQMPRASTTGTLEALNRERDLITIIVANSTKTFEFDLRSVEVYSGNEQINMDDLRIGQGVAVEQVNGKRTIHSLN